MNYNHEKVSHILMTPDSKCTRDYTYIANYLIITSFSYQCAGIDIISLDIYENWSEQCACAGLMPSRMVDEQT